MDRLSVSKRSWIESENNNALRKLVNETLLQQHESLVTESTTLEANLSMDVNALDVGLAVTENIRPSKKTRAMADVQLIAAAKLNSRKVKPHKTKNSNDPVEQKSHTQKPGSWIFTNVGLKWIPTGKMFTDSTTKVGSEPPNGSNEDITNPYECEENLNVSACTFNLSAGLVQNSVSPTTYVPPSKRDYEIPFQPLFDEYLNPPPCVISPDPVAVDAPRPVDPAGSPLSTTIDQDVPSASTSPTNQEIQSQVTHQGVEEQIHGHQNA
ncbi:hypothetical protein Tco_0340937 [Tanacetum coccineum]